MFLQISIGSNLSDELEEEEEEESVEPLISFSDDEFNFVVAYVPFLNDL
jgi:hypothetical protein